MSVVTLTKVSLFLDRWHETPIISGLMFLYSPDREMSSLSPFTGLNPSATTRQMVYWDMGGEDSDRGNFLEWGKKLLLYTYLL